jgi:hypothetical protein
MALRGAEFLRMALDDPQVGPTLMPQVNEFGGPAATAGAIQGLGVVAVVLGAAMGLVGYGMFRGKPWAWPGALALTGVFLLVALLSFPAGLVVLLVAAFLLWYFTRPGVRAWFAAPQAEPGLPSYVPPPP